MKRVQDVFHDDKILVVFGEETYLREQWIHDAVEAWRTQWTNMGYTVSVERYDLSVSDFTAVIEHIRSFNLFSSHMIVIADEALFLTSQMKGADNARRALQEVLEGGVLDSDTVRLILHIPDGKLDARTTVYKLLQKHARLLEAKPLKGKERERWIQEELAARRITLSPQDMEALLYLLPTDLLSISHTFDVLALYAEQNGYKTLRRGDLEAMIPPTFSATVFRLIDTGLEGKAEETFLTLQDLLRQGEEPIKLLSMLMRHLRQLAMIIALAEQGTDAKTIAQTLGVHPFVVQKGLLHLGKWSVEALRGLFNLATSLDVSVKSGEIDKEKALEFLLLAMIHRHIPVTISISGS